jgi:CrcB protein
VNWVALALAGGAGSVLRFVISRSFPVPYGTLVVNVTGAFVLGLISGSFVFGTGFVGAYTTFSTWMLEEHELGLTRTAGAYLALSLAGGLAATGAGWALGSLL